MEKDGGGFRRMEEDSGGRRRMKKDGGRRGSRRGELRIKEDGR